MSLERELITSRYWTLPVLLFTHRIHFITPACSTEAQANSSAVSNAFGRPHYVVGTTDLLNLILMELRLAKRDGHEHGLSSGVASTGVRCVGNRIERI